MSDNELERSILNPGSQPELYREDVEAQEEADQSATREKQYTEVDKLDEKYGLGEKQLIDEQDYGYVRPGVTSRQHRGYKEDVPYVPANRPGHNTGPKGVLADKRAHERAKVQERERQNLEYRAKMERLQEGHISDTPSTSLASTMRNEREQFKKEMNRDDEPSEDEDEDIDVDNIADNEFFQQYRQQRMQELQQASRLPQYGSVIEVEDPNKLLDEINNANYATPVVVHLWEDYEPKCRALNQCLAEAAAKLPHVKFICIKARLASPEGRWDPIALPTLIGYRGGETIASMVRVSDDIGANPGVRDLTSFLESNIPNFEATESAKLL